MKLYFQCFSQKGSNEFKLQHEGITFNDRLLCKMMTALEFYLWKVLDHSTPVQIEDFRISGLNDSDLAMTEIPFMPIKAETTAGELHALLKVLIAITSRANCDEDVKAEMDLLIDSLKQSTSLREGIKHYNQLETI